MKQMLLSLLMVTLLGAGAAQAACYADYKAKRDNPLELHYGVIETKACDSAAAAPEIEKRLAAKGWTLLKVLNVFDASGLNDKRKTRAGQYYLSF